MSEFTWRARVYWEDTDGGGVVYYANYLKYLERARTEWLRSLGHAQSEILRESGLAFAVVGVNIQYRRPAQLDDELTITCVPAREGNAAVQFEQRVYRGSADDLLVEAQVRVACIDTADAGARNACRSFSPRGYPRHESGTVHHPPRRRGQHSRADRDRHPAARIAAIPGPSSSASAW